MNENYERTLEINEEVVHLVYEYQETQDPACLLKVYNLLKSVTMQEITSVLRKSGLPKDLASDMAQDAYVKLGDACLYFNYARCRVFITFWRTSLRNHLISSYQKRWRHQTLIDTDAHQDTKVETDTRNLDDLRDKLLAEFNTWANKKHVAMATKILLERILKPGDDKPSQKELAIEFSLTQSQISNWERWIISAKIAPELEAP